MTTAAASVTPKPSGAAAPVTPVVKKDDGIWKKDFAMVLGTAMVFLTMVDYSFDLYIWNHIKPDDCTPQNIHIQTLVTYYDWRFNGSFLLWCWDLFMLCLLPLFIFGLTVDNFGTLRGKRASLGRHVLDAESAIQLVLTLTIAISRAKPAIDRITGIVNAAANDKVKSGAHDSQLYFELTSLVNYHYLLFLLNALQWCVPLLRLIFQRKQDTIRSRESSVAAALAVHAAEKAERQAAKAAARAVPSAKEMAERMQAAEAMMGGSAAAGVERKSEILAAPTAASLKKRNK